MNKYFNNLETKRIEMHFNKADYMALPDEKRKEIGKYFLWSGKSGAWVSKSKNNHYWPISIAENLGLENGGKIGDRLSYQEELERKSEKAEAKAERFEQYSENAEKRAEKLQSELNSYRGDIAFFTQPIIAGHSGSQAFGNRREKIYARYHKGFEEYKKSEYFRDRAETARQTATMSQLKDPVYIDNRMKECKSTIKKLESNIANYENMINEIKQGRTITNYKKEVITIEQYQTWIDNTLDKMEYEIDKLAFFENALQELAKVLEAQGKKLYSKDDIKKGYLIRVRGIWAKVLKVNPKTVEGDYIEAHMKGCFCIYPYSEIQDINIPDDWKEEIKKIENPFVVGDVVIKNSISGNKILEAFQIIKTTEKTITMQKINVVDNKPIKDEFTSDKQERKTVKQNMSGKTVINYGNWHLHKYED